MKLAMMRLVKWPLLLLLRTQPPYKTLDYIKTAFCYNLRHFALQNRPYRPIGITHAWQKVPRSPIAGQKDVSIYLLRRV